MLSRSFRHVALSRRFASTLVVANSKNGSYDSSLLNTVTAAKEIGGEVTVLTTKECAETVANVQNVDKVISMEYEDDTAENVANVVCAVQKEHNFSHLLFSATNHGKNIMPRVAAMIDGDAISDVQAINTEVEFVRPMYAGNAVATVSTSHTPKVLTIRGTTFAKSEPTGNSAPVEAASLAVDAFDGTKFIEETVEKSERPEITAASVVVSGGRALKSAENFELLYNLADSFPQGAAVGASRAAVDAGYAPNDMQVGQTGKVCAPDLYIAAGISGAIQHVAGMKDSKCIVAINTDEEAPIFQISDYGLKMDLFEAVPELAKKIKS